MPTSWIEQAQQYKSPLAVVAGFLLRSRETQAQRARRRAGEVQRLRKLLQQQQATIASQQEQLAAKDAEIARLKRENRRLREQPPILPQDPPLPSHQFGARMISLCVNLARRIGLRPVPDVLQLVFSWLDAQVELPTWSAIRTWCQRVGIAALQEPVEAADDWIWMADHSNQIGPEKVLVILGVRASNLPPPGEALKHEHVRVLELNVGTRWKRDDMAQVYEQLAQRCGIPRAVLVDGAVELREGAQRCEFQRPNAENTLILGDFKHYAANVLKKIVGADRRFVEFTAQLGRTRSAIQQTELAHLTPLSFRPKARFMNLEPTLKWAQMALWQLAHPDTEARRLISDERISEKLGWLQEFREDIQRWHGCQEVVSAACTFVNTQGLFRGSARALRNHLATLRKTTLGEAEQQTCASRQVAARLLRLVRQSERKLAEGERLPMSTEILESSFGLYKQLEGQHGKGGFTSLLAAYGCLLSPTTAASIRRDFARVSVKDTRIWVSQTLGPTLASRRQAAYREARQPCNNLQFKTT